MNNSNQDEPSIAQIRKCLGARDDETTLDVVIGTAAVVRQYVKRVLQLEQENQQLRHEIDVLRQYGNKDTIAMADEELERQHQESS